MFLQDSLPPFVDIGRFRQAVYFAEIPVDERYFVFLHLFEDKIARERYHTDVMPRIGFHSHQISRNELEIVDIPEVVPACVLEPDLNNLTRVQNIGNIMKPVGYPQFRTDPGFILTYTSIYAFYILHSFLFTGTAIRKGVFCSLRRYKINNKLMSVNSFASKQPDIPGAFQRVTPKKKTFRGITF